MTFNWCRKYMGINNRKHYLPKWYFSRWEDDPKVCGEYDDETKVGAQNISGAPGATGV